MKNLNYYPKLVLILFVLIGLWSCKKDNPTEQKINKVSITGSVEKGPFVQGSVAVIYELNENFVPTGRSFKTELLDDKGTFKLPEVELQSKYVQVTVTGYYFDEVTGALSKSTLSLNAIAEATGNKILNINVLTHLEEKRVKQLIKKGLPFGEAKLQAQKEILTMFYVKPELKESLAENISLLKGDERASVLLGISSILLIYAENDNAKLTELLSKISIDLEEDGKIDQKLRIDLKNNIGDINEERVIDNIKKRYKLLGEEFSLSSIFEAYLDIIISPPLPEPEFDFDLTYNSLLKSLSKYQQHYYFLEGLYTNTITDSKWAQDPFYKHELTPSNYDVNRVFAEAYRNVLYINTIISKARQEINGSEKANYEHKVYPFFSSIYWQLINFYGDPVYVHVGNMGPRPNPRVLTDEVAQELITNLEKSLAVLTGKDSDLADFGRVMIAKLSLQIDNNAKANKYLKEIINSNRYQLNAKENIHEDNKESIYGNFIDANAVAGVNNDNFIQFAKKGKHLSFARYTEVLLLAAETSMRLKEYNAALGYINLVRKRDGESALTDQKELLPALQLQYKTRMNNEGVYFAFLKRNNLAEKVLNIESFRKLFPFPTSEIEYNNLGPQNPGYN